MEIIRIIWILIFFLFTLILLFTWSKVLIISNKIKAVNAMVDFLDSLKSFPEPPPSEETSAEGKTSEPSGAPRPAGAGRPAAPGTAK